MENIDETTTSFIKKVDEKELVSKKHENVSTALNYIEHLFI